MTLLAEIVETSSVVASTTKRGEKTAALAELLRALDPTEIRPVVAWLTGEPRQGKVGVGWAQLKVIAPSPATTSVLTVANLDAALDDVAEATGPGSVERRAAILDRLMGSATPEEQEFVRRVFLGDLRQGALAGLVSDAVSKASDVKAAAVRRGAMLSGDLALTAEVAICEGATAVEAIGLEVGRAVAPMLASTSADVDDALEAIGSGASVEWKLDGARIQVHRNADEVQIFTRNLNDVTDRLPGVAAIVRSFPCESVVLDGEVMGGGETPERFQDLMAQFGSDTPAAGLQPHFFDCLHVDGRDLIDQPLADRRFELERIVGDYAVPAVATGDAAVGTRVLDDALRAGHEGVMVKDLASPYAAGRRGKAWRKVKPVITLDLVVIGVEWGHGRRTGKLSNLHLGARGPDGEFVMVGKTFKGLTDAMLEWQTARFLDLETARDGIVVYVRPEQVVEIALDGVQVSRKYPGGVALRFARVRSYRDDKGPEDADTIESVQALVK